MIAAAVTAGVLLVAVVWWVRWTICQIIQEEIDQSPW